MKNQTFLCKRDKATALLSYNNKPACAETQQIGKGVAVAEGFHFRVSGSCCRGWQAPAFINRVKGNVCTSLPTALIEEKEGQGEFLCELCSLHLGEVLSMAMGRAE